MADKYDLTITDLSGESHGLLCDWTKGGAGLKAGLTTDLKSSAVSTKGDFGVRDASDHFRIVQTDWSEGSGQTTYDRDADSENAYWESRNVDISTVGELRLGPKVVETALAAALPYVIAHGDYAGDPSVWGSFTDAVEPENRIRRSVDGVTWTSLNLTSSTLPESSPVSFASDGETLYCCSSNLGHVYTVNTTEAIRLGTVAKVTHLAFASGTLYAAKSTATDLDAAGAWPHTIQLGTLTSAGVFSALSPAVTTAINAVGTTFGLVASGNYVYWGITNGMVTKVFKALFAGGTGADTLSTVATFPTGFKGCSMHAYLGTVYVGGHFDWTDVNDGIGSIYAIVNDTPALLTDIGSDKTRDNRVLAMSSYERSLFFVSDSQVWRWDLVHGGYSHYAGPLDSTETLNYASIVWANTYAFAVEPTGIGDVAAVESGTGSVDYGDHLPWASGSTAELDCHLSAEVVDVYVPESGIDDSLGTTVELALPATCFPRELGHLSYGGQDFTQAMLYAYFGLNDGAEGVRVNFTRYGSELIGNLKSGVNLLATFTIGALSATHTVRLTLMGTEAKVYADGVLVGSGTTVGSASTKRILYGAENASGEGNPYATIYLDSLRFVTGIYDPAVSLNTPVSGVGLCCWRDHVLAACTGYGEVTTDPTKYAVTPTDGEAPYLVCSRTSGNMPTVEKYFSEMHVTLAIPYTDDSSWSVTAKVTVDGHEKVVSPSADSTTYLLVLPIEESGRSLQYRLMLDTTEELVTPIVTEVAVLFDPTPKVPKYHTYFIRCWRDAEDNSGYDWDEDAPTVSDWLETLAGNVVTIERSGRASYTGRIEELELLEAPPSGKANGREGLYRISVKVV